LQQLRGQLLVEATGCFTSVRRRTSVCGSQTAKGERLHVIMHASISVVW
jgi:hypothetical protein